MVAEGALAFVFWHRPDPTTAPSEYEAGLAAFHRSLSTHAPPGFRASASYRCSRDPFGTDPSGPAVYVDWYLVDGWEALGHLNHEAVRTPHDQPHDAVAARSAHGTGSIYALRAGSGDLHGVRFEAWVDKPRGIRSAEQVRLLAAVPPGSLGSIWQRQLALGPSPEFCIRWSGPRSTADRSMVTVEVRPVARDASAGSAAR